MANMNHDVEVAYLKDVRALETVKYLLQQKKDNASSQVVIWTKDKQKNENTITDYEYKLKKPSERIRDTMSNYPYFDGEELFFTIGKTILISAPILGFLYFLASLALEDGELSMLVVSIIASVIVAIILTVQIISPVRTYSKRKKAFANDYEYTVQNYKSTVKKCRDELPQINTEIDGWKSELNTSKEEYDKAQKLLNKFYAVNIIPSQYRNIQAVYYFYDFVSTSNYSLEQAMENYMHQEIANKLDVIISKMDTIIQNQNQIIISQRQTQAKLDRQAKQNEEMIAKLSSMEENTALSAQYDKISACCSIANTYFSAATYNEILKIK